MPSGVYKRTEEMKRKTSEGVKRLWKNEEYREKVSNSHSHKLDENWKKNISKGMAGKKKSEETKEKMKIAQKKNQNDKNIRMKTSKSWRKQWNSLTKEEQLERLKPWLNAGHKSFHNCFKPSSIELKVKEQLNRYKIKYIQQKPINHNKFVLDFYLPEYQLVIECNGDYWHNLPNRKERDQKLEEYVISKGKDILWLWEHEINDEWFDIADYLEVM